MSYPIANQGFYNSCGCKKVGCKICFPAYNYPWYNPYNFGQYGNNCGKNCGGKCGSTKCCGTGKCDPCFPIKNITGKRKIVTWRVKYLVSNVPNDAAHFDNHLINPWGIVIANNELWVANGTDDSITNYDLHGNKLRAPIRVRDFQHNSAFPTGLVVNCTGGFPVTNGSVTKAAFLITATEQGTVHVYNPLVDEGKSFVVINQTLGGDVVVYKGLTLAGTFLYCADFFNEKIDVFDANYNLQTGFPFIDLDTCNPIPADYGPNNIVHIGCYMYVLYAKHDPNIPVQELDGPGHGYISVFNLDGTFVRRFYSQGVLNSPWAMIPAPCECGFPKDSFLVGNNGDGHINIFTCSGEWIGRMLNAAGIPITIIGLWGLAPYYKCTNEIFFAASPDGLQDNLGLVGSFVVDQVLTC